MTTNTKFLMMLSAGAALLPAATETASAAPAGAAIIIPAPVKDLAPVGGTPMPRLRRTDEEQPGNEMPAFWLSRTPDGKVTNTGLYFAATTELPSPTPGGAPISANRRIQGALVPVTLVLNTDGSITPTADLTKAKFITNNNGQEYRQFNNSTVTDIVGPGGAHYALLSYNFRPNGTNNTDRYAMVLDSTGATVMPQTKWIAFNNDDSCMHQDGSPSVSWAGASANQAMVGTYCGHNGNGNDDGSVVVSQVNFQSATAATIKIVFDTVVCQREERSRGTVRLTPDKKALIASWTEGNTQPQRDGVWMAAIDLTKGTTGRNQQSALAWKQQIAGRVDLDGVRTYAMRAKMEQLTDQAGLPSNQFIYSSFDVSGNNNGNGKGGTYRRSNVGVIEASLTGMKYIVKPINTAGVKGAMDGIDGTHLGEVYGMFGKQGSAVPGVAFMAGNHFGGGDHSDIRVVTFNATTGAFANAGNVAGAPSDRHMYSNYLGNNPGNQGRNHSHGQIIDNPFAGQPNVTATQLLVYATTAKAPTDLLKPEIKLAGWLTVVPVQDKVVSNPVDPTNPDPTTPADPSNPDAQGDSLGGCSAGGSAGLATFLLLGLVGLIRRRR